MKAWDNFKPGKWQTNIDVSEFIRLNYKEYLGDSSFLAGATENSIALNRRYNELLKEEKIKGGVIDMDTEVVSSLTSHGPGYIIKSKEKIVGLQTDYPFKRAFFPFGGMFVAKKASEAYGYHISDKTNELFTEIRKTHNQGVFDVYTPEIRKARKSHVITGLPDGYGRGRIIGDYRRVALYGVDFLIENKKKDKEKINFPLTEDRIRDREEIQEQIRSLEKLKEMALLYGFDISKPATNASDAIQWLYFGYLGAVKEQNGAAMSLGRTSTFLDIYIERDMEKGILSEPEVQELIDHFVMKLRMVRYTRTPEYNSLFTGDPTWVTESIGGMQKNEKKSLVTKTSFRYLQTLYNLDTSAEPNLTVLWSEKLPVKFKEFCAKVSIDTSSIQYESDDYMRHTHGDDYAIACCVSPMKVGKSMQFFGARANLAKALLYAINGGKDEISGEQVSPPTQPVENKMLDFDDVMKRFDKEMDWLAEVYVNALNVIHYMHDKYAYERLQMALHDSKIERTFATGVAGLSVVADSLSAIKHAKVYPVFSESGIVTDFNIEGNYPKYGNNDDRVDDLAIEIVSSFMKKIRKNKTYRKAIPTMSVLTITSNVVYGMNTGNTPDGRRAGEPFAPGANPMHGRDTTGALNSLLSVAKLPYCDCQDGISNTFNLVPEALGKDEYTALNIKEKNLVDVLDGYFNKGGYHLNVNILNRETLSDAYNHPEKYPNLTIRVSGYAVNFANLTDEQKLDVINRTFHERI